MSVCTSIRIGMAFINPANFWTNISKSRLKHTLLQRYSIMFVCSLTQVHTHLSVYAVLSDNSSKNNHQALRELSCFTDGYGKDLSAFLPAIHTRIKLQIQRDTRCVYNIAALQHTCVFIQIAAFDLHILIFHYSSVTRVCAAWNKSTRRKLM